MNGIVEIWEKDPMSGGGCACAPIRITQAQADSLVRVMRQRDETIERLRLDFPGLRFERDVVHPQRPRSSYPDHVRVLIDEGADPPLFFYNKELVYSGSFPAYDEIKTIIERVLATTKIAYE